MFIPFDINSQQSSLQYQSAPTDEYSRDGTIEVPYTKARILA